MELALTLARLCLGAEDLEPARTALLKAAECLEQLEMIEQSGGHEDRLIRLEADYLAMRIALVIAPTPAPSVFSRISPLSLFVLFPGNAH